jgi:hypothetical protein
LEEFTAKTSNPENVAIYLEYWDNNNIDLDKGLDKNRNKDKDNNSDDLVVIISEDKEKENNNKKKDLADFINNNKEL